MKELKNIPGDMIIPNANEHKLRGICEDCNIFKPSVVIEASIKKSTIGTWVVIKVLRKCNKVEDSEKICGYCYKI